MPADDDTRQRSQQVMPGTDEYERYRDLIRAKYTAATEFQAKEGSVAPPQDLQRPAQLTSLVPAAAASAEREEDKPAYAPRETSPAPQEGQLPDSAPATAPQRQSPPKRVRRAPRRDGENLESILERLIAERDSVQARLVQEIERLRQLTTQLKQETYGFDTDITELRTLIEARRSHQQQEEALLARLSKK